MDDDLVHEDCTCKVPTEILCTCDAIVYRDKGVASTVCTVREDWTSDNRVWTALSGLTVAL